MDARFVLGVASWAQLPDDGLPEVAFVGRSNVGKSSLINMLLGRKGLAKTSGSPGKTQQLNFFLIDERLYVVDLPGYGYARVSQTERGRWARLIERYVSEREPLRIIFHLIDSRHEPSALDREMLGLARTSPASYVMVLTKTDKLSGNERQARISAMKRLLKAEQLEVPLILTSATDRRGRDEIWEWIESIAV